MSLKTTSITLVLLVFGVFSGYVMYQIGYTGIWRAGFSGLGEMQILADLVIACAVIGLWMIGDARARGINPLPYLLLVLVGGSLGVLLYLLRRQAVTRTTAPLTA